MPTISALVHTLNEENNIADCLTCLRWCDEIVVVDMMSDDRTVDIARRFTDRIYSVPRMGLADPARKFGLEKTAGDWILIVDADELIPRTLMERLRKAAEASEADIVFLPGMTYILGEWIRHTAWWPEYHPRFFRRDMAIPGKRVHDRYRLLSDKVLRLEPRPEFAIRHFNYLNSHHFLHKLNRYTDLEAQAFKEDDKRSFSFFRLIFRPAYEFLVRFFYKKGFLDGTRGFLLSSYMAFYRFVAEAKLWEKTHNPDPAGKYDAIKKAVCGQYGNLGSEDEGDKTSRPI